MKVKKQEPKKKRRLVTKALLILLIALTVIKVLPKQAPSETSLRTRVVRLSSELGSCSGQQVIAASGASYILTAGHCNGLANIRGEITVHTEDGRQLPRRIIMEDPTSDLLLLEGLPFVEGLTVADSLSAGEHVFTLTHGNAFDTYKTEGAVIQDFKIQVPIADGSSCPKLPKFSVKEFMTLFGPLSYCILEVVETVTTAMIVPGSSGGAVFNDSGELVGVVSAGDTKFGYLVRLNDVKNFLSNF